MKWTAHHFDGFTERLLSYTITCDCGIAELEAHWFEPGVRKPSFSTIFDLDDSRLREALPILRRMRERYDAPMEDVGCRQLIIEVDGETIKRTVAGAGYFLDEHPELQTFLDLFAWLEQQLSAQLSESGRDVPDWNGFS